MHCSCKIPCIIYVILKKLDASLKELDASLKELNQLDYI